MEICSQRFAQPVKFLKATAIINKKLDFASTERWTFSALQKKQLNAFPSSLETVCHTCWCYYWKLILCIAGLMADIKCALLHRWTWWSEWVCKAKAVCENGHMVIVVAEGAGHEGAGQELITERHHWACPKNPCSHILHTCQPSNSQLWHVNPIHFEWCVHEQTCPLQLQLCWHMHSVLPQMLQNLGKILAVHLPGSLSNQWRIGTQVVYTVLS